MRHDDLVDRSGGRHRMARHRAPSAFERRRDRTLDLYAPTISGNGGYGISCEAVVVSNACTFTGGSNASGDLDGCQFCTAL